MLHPFGYFVILACPCSGSLTSLCPVEGLVGLPCLNAMAVDVLFNQEFSGTQPSHTVVEAVEKSAGSDSHVASSVMNKPQIVRKQERALP